MAEYLARNITYWLVTVAVAGLLLIAAPKCREDRPKQDTAEKRRVAEPVRKDIGGDSEEDALPIIFHGASDASAAIVLDERTLLVADDENNILRAYGIEGGSPLFQFDLTDFLDIEGKFTEVDIEGAARIGNRAYWISSHGRNRNGKWRPNRCRFFATEILTGPRRVAIGKIGRPYAKLAEKLIADPDLRAVCPNLAESFRRGKIDGDHKRRLAPKDQGLNIEGLCASADGERLYIGLRNPQGASRGTDADRAIVIPLLNPSEIIDQTQQPRFGRPLLWNLGGLGIRDMVLSPHHRDTFVLAGPQDGEGRFALYRWSGDTGQQPVFLRQLGSDTPDLRPEALTAFPGSNRLMLLSDDGGMPVPVGGPSECIDAEYYRSDGTSLNKHLRDEDRRSFRARWVTP